MKAAAALRSRSFLDSHDMIDTVIDMNIRRLFLLFLLLCLLLSGCQSPSDCDIAATTYPVYAFTQYLCKDTPLQVERVITENVSCLHDYTLQVHQMQLLQGAETVVISGAGLEDFMEDALSGCSQIIDASEDIPLLDAEECHSHEDAHGAHHHETDPHIWLSPAHAIAMAENICAQLSVIYPEYAAIFEKNLAEFCKDMEALEAYAKEKLQDLSCRQLITFHDGFSYLAQACDLTILKAIEEESGSEASARELIELANLITSNHIPAIFIEKNGSVAAAQTISAETGAAIYTLDMGMSGEDYFTVMRRNIDTLWEALK